jgi:ABC-type sugar transport system ATPase subunit
VTEPLLEGRGLAKAYDGITVVDAVDISVAAGEIHAVIGENGAGKSTLMSILTGIVRPDAGEIRLRGALLDLRYPRKAAESGIAIVHQEHQLVRLQSVADNLMLVRPPGSRTVITGGKPARRPGAHVLRRGGHAETDFVRSTLDRVGLRVDPRIPVSALSTAQCQLVEIAKALTLDARILIFDEPTAALLPAEAARLLTLIEGLRAGGRAILYISHALDEILRLADRISVLRDGRLVGRFKREEVDRDTLIQVMVDRPVRRCGYELPLVGQRVAFSAQELTTRHVRDVSFEIHEGEILGFAGLMGCGMQDAALALGGAQRISSGTLTLGGTITHFRSPYGAVRAGVVMVPEERKREGIVSARSVCENLHLGRYRPHARWGFINPSGLRVAASNLVQRFQIRLASIDQPIASLSGGNQQKALIARCIQTEPRVLIMSSPTRGVDIGAKDAIHKIILELAARGTAIILVSPEIEELLGLAHRIAVFSQGRMTRLLPRSEATPTRILQLAIGDGRAPRDSRACRAT